MTGPIPVAQAIEAVQAAAVSVVLFRPDDGFPLCYGYMVGPDDGKSVLYPTPEEAIEAHRQTAMSGTSANGMTRTR